MFLILHCGCRKSGNFVVNILIAATKLILQKCMRIGVVPTRIFQHENLLYVSFLIQKFPDLQYTVGAKNILFPSHSVPSNGNEHPFHI